MRDTGTEKPVKTWKVVLGVVTLAMFCFMGFVIGDWLGLILGVVFWVVAVGWLMLGRDISAALDAAKQKKPSVLDDSALEILDKRYASGEVSKEEYDEKKRDITSKG